MIKIENLNFSYRDGRQVLHNFDLDIEQGCLFGLLGPNGAGKTTLISLVAGLLKPDSGSISIDGKTYGDDRHSILSNLALVPQEYAFYPKMTAKENLLFFSGLYSKISNQKARIARALELTGLQSYEHRKAETFSGGLKRRLNLAIGLLHEPSLLILDEPTVGIDPQSREFILTAIDNINKQGVTVIYTSHYMEEVEKLCDRVAIVDHGKILSAGTVSELLTQDSSLKIVFANPRDENWPPDELCQFASKHLIHCNQNQLSAPDLSDELVLELLSLLKKYSVEIREISYGKRSLEDLFFQLTKTHLRDN